MQALLEALGGARRLAFAAGLVAVISLGVGGCRGPVSCFGETSYCPDRQAKDGYYAGTIARPGTHVPLANRRLPIYFESHRDYVTTITTGAGGQYCIVWAEERISPAVKLEPNLDVVLHDPWQPQPVPPGCETTSATVPWDGAEDYTSSWQWAVLIYLPVTALAVLLAARLARRRRPSVSDALYATGAVAALTSAVLVLAL